MMNLSLIEILQRSDGWVVKNLKDFGNSLIPEKIHKNYKTEVIEGLLGVILEENVVIEKRKLSDKDEIYVAKVRKGKEDGRENS